MAEREASVVAGSEELEVLAAEDSATVPLDRAEVGSAGVRPEAVEQVVAEREALAVARLEEVEVRVADLVAAPADRAEAGSEEAGALAAPDSIAPGHPAAQALAGSARDLPAAIASRRPAVVSSIAFLVSRPMKGCTTWAEVGKSPAAISM
jgi:hypothetical protein